ncbi:MAG: hypothetical protein WBV94_15665 [Blastocatellia bacterium]
MRVESVGYTRSDEDNAPLYRSIAELYQMGPVLWIGEAHGFKAKLYGWTINAGQDILQPFNIDSAEALTGQGSFLWISSSYGKIYKWIPQSPMPQSPDFDLSASVGSLVRVKSLCWAGNILLIGSEDGRLFSWKENDTSQKLIRGFGAAIKAIAADGETLWVGTYKGLYRLQNWQRSSDQSSDQPFLLPDKKVRSLFQTDKAMWIGMQDEGLYRWDKQPNSDAIPILPDVESVYSLFGNQSTLWVGTEKGLLKIEGLDSPWTGKINPKSDLAELKGGQYLTWEVSNYDWRATPQTLFQQVIIDGQQVATKASGINYDAENNLFSYYIDPSKDIVGSTIEIRATDLTNSTILFSHKVVPSAGTSSSGLMKLLMWILGSTASFIVAFAGALLALKVLKRDDENVFSRTWLISVAADILNKLPGTGRRYLFLGYNQRVAGLKQVREAAGNYYSLPAESSDGKVILPKQAEGSDEDELINEVIKSLGPQQPVLIVGKGGAGKSTFLSRLAHLAVTDQLGPSMAGYIPLFIPASDYSINLLGAIADTLRQRDRLGVNLEIIESQLQSGKFLILFDGVSDIPAGDDKRNFYDEIIRTARNADYSNSRFVISSRPFEGITGDVHSFTLQPLNAQTVLTLLDSYNLSDAKKNQVKLQLRSFGSKPIEPLLFSMILKQGDDEQLGTTRADIYERYFKRQLRLGEGVNDNRDLWDAWLYALQALANWTFIETGKRGIGLPHDLLIENIRGDQEEAENIKGLLNRLHQYFDFTITAPKLLNKLQESRLLQKERRWRFTHDTFEEYFAACRIITYFDRNNKWPSLDPWKVTPSQIEEFLDILDFVRQMTEDEFRRRMIECDLPAQWKERLSEKISLAR